MEIPPRAIPENDAGYLEKLTEAVFQPGLSWAVIRQKWPGFQAVFLGFAVPAVAAFDERDIERLLEDSRIVRNGRKIKATIDNARVMHKLIQEHGSFYAYLRTLDGQDYGSRAKILIKQFKFLGDMGAYFFLWSVGEEVIPYEEWSAARKIT